ncbi:SDR family NAD(P)-dependent oxidoreductase [Actinoplanes palleronii]|uniref:Short-chain dehydrogenase/reductase n=1 Tax=Actinoplanes palleronii TaxID=113570 RepID=A0ABQ4B9X1_9ACTN|nr:SDR family NAD(P)-dependent oxidoreductase [Actinoplanes palleronii]GIE67468.1 short-chain dehydrogenase/reductase [Actinoplanes palleronii]
MSAVVITGTSSGIGLATAVAAARAGHQVVATLRDPTRSDALRTAAEAAGVTLDIRRLDVTDDESVTSCLTDVAGQYGTIAAVINNAGAAHLGTLETDGMDALRRVLEVNFFGVARVSTAAMPYLRAGKGRLLAVSSVGGVIGQPFNEAYCAAKFAVEGLYESLHPVAAAMGVRVSLVEPGAVASDFVDHLGDNTARLAASGPYRALLEAYLARTEQAFAAAQRPEDVADVIVQLLADPTPPLRVQTSAGAARFSGIKLADLDGSAVTSLTSTWITAAGDSPTN